VDEDGVQDDRVERQLLAELGAGPLALARAQRVQTARLLIETGTLPMGDVAFAAGFASIRAFNDTVRELGLPVTPAALTRRAAPWRPWRAYAVQYLWATGDHAINRMMPADGLAAQRQAPGIRQRRREPA
jgi:Helix-turn-helix domain